MNLKILASGSYGNCYVLEHKGKMFLLDVGISHMEIKKGINFKVADIVGVFVSHIHSDHSKSANNFRKMGIPIFEPYKGGVKMFSGKGFTLKAFDVSHDGTPNCGVAIQCPDGHRVLYLTDLEYCRYTFRKARVDTILIELNYQQKYLPKDEAKTNHVLRGHMSEETCIEFLKANQTDALKTVVLCHLSQGSCDPNEVLKNVKTAVGKSVTVIVAEKGVTIKL